MKGKKRSKRAARRFEESTYYALRIDRWDWDYGFSVGNSCGRQEEAFSDFRHLTVSGVLTHPHDLAGEVAKEMTFISSRDLLGPVAHRFKTRPDTVGQIRRDRKTKTFEGTFSIPTDVLSPLIPMLIAGRLSYLVLEGARLRSGSSSIRSYSFNKNITSEDFPQGQFESALR